MEDVGIPIPCENMLKPTLSGEVRIRDEFDDHGGGEGDDKDGEKRQKLDEIDDSTPKQGGAGGVGIFDNLMAKLSSPRASSKPSGAEACESGDGFVDTETGGGGGVINNLLSGLFHGKSGEGENGGGEEGKKVNVVDGGEVANKEGLSSPANSNSNNNGGNIISNLIRDDVAPAADEASILIHSVVHD